MLFSSQSSGSNFYNNQVALTVDEDMALVPSPRYEQCQLWSERELSQSMLFSHVIVCDGWSTLSLLWFNGWCCACYSWLIIVLDGKQMYSRGGVVVGSGPGVKSLKTVCDLKGSFVYRCRAMRMVSVTVSFETKLLWSDCPCAENEFHHDVYKEQNWILESSFIARTCYENIPLLQNCNNSMNMKE